MTEIHEHVAYISEDIIKPKLDRRQWRFVKLKNEMRVLIISDKDADQSAAAMNVSIGKFSNSMDLLGCWHTRDNWKRNRLMLRLRVLLLVTCTIA